MENSNIFKYGKYSWSDEHLKIIFIDPKILQNQPQHKVNTLLMSEENGSWDLTGKTDDCVMRNCKIIVCMHFTIYFQLNMILRF